MVFVKGWGCMLWRKPIIFLVVLSCAMSVARAQGQVKEQVKGQVKEQVKEKEGSGKNESGGVLEGAKGVMDGPVIGVLDKPDMPDTPEGERVLPPMLRPSIFGSMQMKEMLFGRQFFVPPGYETKEQRAARINSETYSSLMSSINQSLAWQRLPNLSPQARMALPVGKLFLSNPYAFPTGAVPLMNHSFPFIYVYTPGMAPYPTPYSEGFFPKAIQSDYDPATGTYKQMMVGWDEYQKKLNKSMGGSFKNEPLP